VRTSEKREVISRAGLSYFARYLVKVRAMRSCLPPAGAPTWSVTVFPWKYAVSAAPALGCAVSKAKRNKTGRLVVFMAESPHGLLNSCAAALDSLIV
jgi:hypothetical protein